jgi:hypothetical protein
MCLRAFQAGKIVSQIYEFPWLTCLDAAQLAQTLIGFLGLTDHFKQVLFQKLEGFLAGDGPLSLTVP